MGEGGLPFDGVPLPLGQEGEVTDMSSLSAASCHHMCCLTLSNTMEHYNIDANGPNKQTACRMGDIKNTLIAIH